MRNDSSSRKLGTAVVKGQAADDSDNYASEALMPPLSYVLRTLQLTKTINKHTMTNLRYRYRTAKMVEIHLRKSKLRGFLKKEVQKKRLKAPESDPLEASDRTPTGGYTPTRANNHFAFQTLRDVSTPGSPARSVNAAEDSGSDSLFGGLVDSLFGEPLGTPPLREQELQRLLAEPIPITSAPKLTESSNLKYIREELKAVVLLETDGKSTVRERRLVGRQKGSLIKEIRYMMETERKAFDGLLNACLL